MALCVLRGRSLCLSYLAYEIKTDDIFWFVDTHLYIRNGSINSSSSTHFRIQAFEARSYAISYDPFINDPFISQNKNS